MEIQSLNCVNCGAQLRVPDGATFTECSHCGSQLAIHRTETSQYTERIERLEERVARLDERTRQTDKDRQWERERVLQKTRQTKEDESVVVVIASIAMVFLLVLVACSATTWAGLAMSLISVAAIGAVVLSLYRAALRQRQANAQRLRDNLQLPNIPRDVTSEL